MKGQVKWFNDSKGYGFIESEELPGKSIFAHWQSIQTEGFKTISEGQQVEFILIDGPKGPVASAINPVRGE